MIRLFKNDRRNLTVAVFDSGAKVYEIFADQDCDSYIGCADNIQEAQRVALDWVNEV